MAARINTDETIDVHETGEHDPELGEHTEPTEDASDMDSEDVSVTRAEPTPVQNNHDYLVESQPYISVDAIALAQHKSEQTNHNLGEYKHALKATDANENDSDIEDRVFTKIREADTAERITNTNVVTASAMLNHAKLDQAVSQDIEIVSLNTDVKDRVAKNNLASENALDKLSKVSDSIEREPKATAVSQENYIGPLSDDTETKSGQAVEHVNNLYTNCVQEHNTSFNHDPNYKYTAESEPKEMESNSKEKEDTHNFHQENLSETIGSDNQADDNESKSSLVQDYVTSEQIDSLIKILK